MRKLLLSFCYLLFYTVSSGQSSLFGYYYQDTISFEEIPIIGFSIDSLPNNLWQIGYPNKPTLNQPFTGLNSIITDTITNYSASNKSCFTIDLEKFLTNDTGYVGMIYDVSFDYSIQADEHSGGYILLSGDSINWYNIFDEDSVGLNLQVDCRPYSNALSGYGGPGLYPDTLFNGQLGFEGVDLNNRFSFSFGQWLLKSNIFPHNFRPFVRFVFESDTNAMPNEGWLIDNIGLGIAFQIGSVSESLSKSITLYPNPANDKLAFDFDGNKFKPTELTITNVVGQRILEAPFSKTVDISTLQQGVYYVTITDDKRNSAAKMFFKE